MITGAAAAAPATQQPGARNRFLLLLSRSDLGNEGLDLPTKLTCLAGELRRRPKHLRSGCASLVGRLVDPSNVRREVLNAGGGLLHVAGNLGRCRSLLLYRRCDGRGDPADL